jgi:type IV secretion system protein VirB4
MKFWRRKSEGAVPDPPAGERLPYAGHFDDETLITRNGDLLQMIRVEGYPFETADSETLNYLHSVRDVMFRSIAGSQLMLYSHVVRRRVATELVQRQPEGFARDLDKAWKARLAGRRIFVNDIVLTLVRRTPVGKVGLWERLTRRLRGLQGDAERAAAEARAVRELTAARTSLTAALARYSPQVLGRYKGRGGTSSEPLEILSALYNGELQPVLEPSGDAGNYIPYKRVSFGIDTIELRGADAAGLRLGAMLSLKDYPASTSPGILDNLLRLPHELTVTESFAFLDRQVAGERIGLSLRRLRAVSEETVSQRQQLMAAREDLVGGGAAYGEHHLTIHVRAATLAELDAAVADVQSAVADFGGITVRESVNLEAAFWGQFPGNADYIARRAMVSTANLAGLVSLHGFPIGDPGGSIWGEPITVLETSSSTPYFFNLHKGDLGNFTLIGPSGSGKTVVLNFLVGQAQKFLPRTILFDKDRGAELFIRALGGQYEVIRPGVPTAFNPLQLPDTASNRAFLHSWVAQLAGGSAQQHGGGSRQDPEEAAIIAEAVDANFAQAPEFRQLRYFVELLAGGRRPVPGDLAARLGPWYGLGEHAWLFDNPSDETGLQSRVAGFDMTAVLETPTLRTPAMMYLFHRVEERLDGSPSLIVIDEGWRILDDAVFVNRLKDWMKTIRKRNGAVGFVTQSASDALDSRIASTIIEQSATQLFMSNPRAQAGDYCDGFGLTPHELELVRTIPDHLRCVLVKQGAASVVARLDMSDMSDILTILSARESTVRQLDRIRAEVGNAPDAWMPRLLRAAAAGSGAMKVEP